MASHTVRVTYRGAVHSVAVSPDASVGDLGASLEDATKASVATQKILGVRSRPGGVLLPGRDADARLLVADVPGLADAPKPFMLVGTPASAIAALDAAPREQRPAFDAIAKIFNERTHTGWTTGGHTGVDVPLYATGPGSERFRGVMQNEDVGRVMKEVFLPE